MLHKISDFCRKIESIKQQADMLKHIKYGRPKSEQRDSEIKHLIEQIQADCYLVSQDKEAYKRVTSESEETS